MNYIWARCENPAPSNADLSLFTSLPPLLHWSLFIAAPHRRPPLPGLTKADSSKLSFWDCLFHFELDTKLLFLTVELFSMLDTNILISCYLS